LERQETDKEKRRVHEDKVGWTRMMRMMGEVVEVFQVGEVDGWVGGDFGIK
jgi:hypothetical protein